MDFYVGQICMYPAKWAPRTWIRCDGQLLKIQDFQALFALLRFDFGGDGKTTFALPKMNPIKPENGGDVAYYICSRGVFPPRG